MYILPLICVAWAYISLYIGNILQFDIISTFFITYSGIFAINIRSHIKFYNWWNHAKLSDGKQRGLSTNGYPLFGLIKIPILSNNEFLYTGIFLLLTMLIAIFIHSIYLFTTIFFVSVIYLGQLWAERSASYHRECLFITGLLYLTINPSIESIGLFKLHISCIYFIGALEKIGYSFICGRPWFLYAPQTFIWKAYWASPYWPTLQKYAIQSPRLLSCLGLCILLIELFAPFHHFLTYYGQCFFFTSLIMFHIGVFFLQGIDYITFWGTALIAVGYVDTPLPTLEGNYLSWTILAFQLFYSFFMLENFNINIPPFTCCPMFVNCCTIAENIPQTYVLIDTNNQIAFPRLEWMFPYVYPECGMGFDKQDINKIPFRFISFGKSDSVANLLNIQKKWIRDKDKFFIWSNTHVSYELHNRLYNLIQLLHEYDNPNFQYDPSRLQQIITERNICYNMFLSQVN